MSPPHAKLPRRSIAPAENAVITARPILQEARTALEREEYARVREMTAALSTEMKAALTGLDTAAPPAARSRKR